MANTEHRPALLEAISALNSANQARAAAEAAQRAAQAEILGIVEAMRQQVDNLHDPNFLAVLRHLYWQHPGVPSSKLSKIAGFRSPLELTQAIGPVPSGLTCERCQKSIMRTSRSWQPPNMVGGRLITSNILCKQCTDAERYDRDVKWRIEALRRRHVQHAPVAAPTIEWQVAAALVLAYPPIAVSRRDQDDREGFWTSYDLAQELNQALADTSATHVSVTVNRGARILDTATHVAGWDIGRTWEVVIPLTQEPPTVILTRLGRRIREVQQQRQAEAVKFYPDDYMPAGGWPDPFPY